ncbi:DNA internalization-related competence protein ComEC/Rec2 [Pseudidiomarina homiensis]|uniref:DNA internalization-related competence protein ComEC/Rec2 n=1 Tax=Pseudidiomarina homiensis TaxID=364198 RepID=UPI00215A6273|nr:DNA internalization-related competence protein ComEC/Rec2 [Pseudidiomarina homiensis]
MDRWLCAFLGGYALSFCFHQTASLALLTLIAVLASICFVLGYCTRLQSIFLGCVLCGILWGAGNAYFVTQQHVANDWFQGDIALTLAIDTITARQENAWRITAIVAEAPKDLSLPLPQRVRLHWYDPHANGAQRIPRAGERWRMVVRLKPPQGTRNEGGMRYHRHLLAQGIQALGTIRSGVRLAPTNSTRQRVVARLQRALTDVPQAGVLLALLVGERFALSADEWQVVQRTGLAHLLAISGMHLSLVTGFVFALAWHILMRWPRTRRQREQMNLWQLTPWCALPVALLYAWLAGFAIATLRALLMLLVIWWHKAYACRVSSFRVVLRAVIVVILLQPLAPLSMGFWLSVGAVASIFFMNWRWLHYRGRAAKLKALWRFEWLITLLFVPVMAAAFGGVASAAALTNLVVVPLVSLWVLPVGLIGLVCATANQLAWGQWWLQLAIWPLNKLWPYLDRLAEQPWQWLVAAQLPPWPWLVVGVTVIIVPVVWRWRLLGVAVLMFTYFVVQAVPPNSAFQLHVLDVEQGSALVVERQGHAMLIDTGASWDGFGSMAERVIVPFLQERRLRPELGFITHTDRDHEGGYKVLSEQYAAVRWYGGRHGAPCLAGQSGTWRGVTWRVLHPRHAAQRGNHSNNDSCVIVLRLGQVKVLVTGDIEKQSERKLLAELAPVQADLLVIPHHGSKSSSESYFVRHVKPAAALLSRGRNSAYGHPHREVMATYQALRVPIIDTARGGQITVHSDGVHWSLEQPLSAALGYWFDVETSQ